VLRVLVYTQSDGVVSEWSTWSSCDKHCRRHRRRQCHVGVCDNGLDLETEDCPSRSCTRSALTQPHDEDDDDDGHRRQSVDNQRISAFTFITQQQILSLIHLSYSKSTDAVYNSVNRPSGENDEEHS